MRTLEKRDKKRLRLKIKEEFSRILPKHEEYELEQLAKSICRDGCLMPITVWGDTIVDGHARYRICKENRIPFEIHRIDFESDEEAIEWIITNQLCLRGN